MALKQTCRPESRKWQVEGNQKGRFRQEVEPLTLLQMHLHQMGKHLADPRFKGT